MADKAVDRQQDGNQSLSRGMKLIEFLSDYPNGCPLAKIAEETGLNKSTAHRLLRSLHALGYVAPAPAAGSYRLTSRLVSVGYKAYSSLNIITIASPHLEKLNLDTGDTVSLSCREGNDLVIIYKLEPTSGSLRTRSYIGQRLSLYSSAMGKAHLAYGSKALLEKYWREEGERIVKRTTSTIVDWAPLQAELTAVRRDGVAYDREENEAGISCIAAPLFGLQDRVEYAMSVSVPAFRLDEALSQGMADRVKAAAALISRDIGGGS